MPIPLVAIGLAAAGISIGSTVHSTLKVRKWKKIHDEALEKCKRTEASTKASATRFNGAARLFGEFRVESMEGLKEAAEFLQKAKVKHRKFDELDASIPDVTIQHWSDLHLAALKAIVRGTAGITGATGAATVTVAGMYSAAGIFGVASTGTPIASLTGAAAHSARLAWLGGGALSAGGAGVAAGLSRLALAGSVVAIPIGIGAAAWGQWKAQQLKGKVEVALKEFARAEVKMREQSTIMNAGKQRIDELKDSILSTRSALTEQLQMSDEGNIEDLHRVYKVAHTLAELLEEPVLTFDQQRVLQG